MISESCQKFQNSIVISLKLDQLFPQFFLISSIIRTHILLAKRLTDWKLFIEIYITLDPLVHTVDHHHPELVKGPVIADIHVRPSQSLCCEEHPYNHAMYIFPIHYILSHPTCWGGPPPCWRPRCAEGRRPSWRPSASQGAGCGRWWRGCAPPPPRPRDTPAPC